MDTSYEAKTSNYFEDQRREMAVFIPATAKCMLEVGCGNAAFAAYLKSQRKIEVTAIEPHAAAAEAARSRVDHLVCADFELALPMIAGQKFDCILMNDVLEHLVDPWSALKRLREFLAPAGVLVASIPNIRYLPVFKKFVLRGSWQYEQDGVMDRTHLRFFTESSTRELFESTGYRLREITGINGIELPWKFALVNILSGRAISDTRYKQFACVASRADVVRTGV